MTVSGEDVQPPRRAAETAVSINGLMAWRRTNLFPYVVWASPYTGDFAALTGRQHNFTGRKPRLGDKGDDAGNLLRLARLRMLQIRA